MSSTSGLRVTQNQRIALNASLQASLRVLHSDAAGLARYLEEQAAETPALVLRPALPSLGEWLPRWQGAGPGLGLAAAEAVAATGPSLAAHVLEALPGLVPRAADRPVALALAEALEPTGWLGRTTAQIAQEAAVPEAAVLAVLRQLQKIDPAGLFARDLAECLRLQAMDAGQLDPVLEVMIANLPLVASGDWDRLARLAGVDQARLRQAFARLRSFNPKPGTAFSGLSSPLREPDLTVRQTGAGAWEVALNRSCLPEMDVRPGAEGAGRAKALIQMVAARNATLLAVARDVLAHQAAALGQGAEALRPLTMQEVADRLDLHKSTVSRVVAGAAVDTPQGTWWLRSLFSKDMGADLGAAALRARLVQLVAGEDRERPLSDDALAAALSEGGAVIARRTVAKYRAALRIAPAHRRRLRGAAQGGGG